MSAADVTGRNRMSDGRFGRTGSRVLQSMVVGALAMFLFVVSVPSAMASTSYPARSIAQLIIDDDGQPLHYPSTIFFDPTEEEIYVVNGGSARVVVYGPDFYPRVSIGRGRSVAAPRGIYLADDGKVYITQSRTASNAIPRITVLNGAFFVEREIILDDIPELGDLSPAKLAVSREGLIYLTGESSRGVIVLDRDGTFLRRLEPMDQIADREAIAAAAERMAQQNPSREDEEVLTTAASRGDIPEEFRPRSRQQETERRPGPGLGPVRVRNVIIDNAGNLYLVSAETSRIYVYGPDETFLFAFGEKGGTPRRLSQPRGIAIDEKRGLIYVADFMRHTILAYDMKGKWLFEVGGRGVGPGWFNFPSDLAVTRHGHLVVADLFNRRVQVLDVEYTPEFPIFPTPSRPPAPSEDEEEAEPADDEETPETDDIDDEAIIEEMIDRSEPARITEPA